MSRGKHGLKQLLGGLPMLWATGIHAEYALDPIVLYDDSHQPPLNQQGWLTHVSTMGTAPVPVAAGLALDSRPSGGGTSGQAGLFSHSIIPFFPNASQPVNPDFPDLDPWLGFTLSFELQIHDEDHISGNRAGFSVIVLGNDRRGVEMGFWEDRIWTQSDDPLFTQAEGVGFNTTAGEILYALTISGLDYLLEADGIPILSGGTRDYTGFSGLIDPYQTPNLVFLGDDTSSAAASVTLGRVALQIDDRLVHPTPAPSSLTLLAPTLLLLIQMGRKQSLQRKRYEKRL